MQMKYSTGTVEKLHSLLLMIKLRCELRVPIDVLSRKLTKLSQDENNLTMDTNILFVPVRQHS